ncbi:MAG: ABC transporter ATP-binding protein [Candidatus Saganbacteria bacterium]|nr:ABC transporter ATP-binding protein [Candidatus Saganbacteria bacterium]
MSDLALAVKEIVCGYDGLDIIKGVSFEVERGEFVGIVGANGCGKTTLLRALIKLLPVNHGGIEIYGKNLVDMKRKEISQKVALVPQMMEPVKGFTVSEMILLGRTPYFERFSFETEDDHAVKRWVIQELKMEDIADTPVTNLSGGEFQRVAIARALAQEPKLMLLDEPISHLDIRYQVKILKLLRKIRQTRTVIATFHDLNMAARFCQRLILMKNGIILASGKPDEVLTRENIWKAYRIKAEVRTNPKTKHAKLILLP